MGRTVSVGDGHEPKLFDVWGAKAFAGISLAKHLPDATMSRGIVIVLRRKLQHETVERLRHADPSLFAGISAKLARFAADYSAQVRTARPHLPDELSDRAQDNWEALLAIAGCAGPEWVERATTAALKLSLVTEDSVSASNELLADIRQVFASKGSLKIPTVDLIDALVAGDDYWGTYNHGKPISPRQLAKQLAAYDIKPKTVRQGEATPKGYDATQFEDAFARYLTAPENLPQQRNAATEPNTGEAGSVADGPQPIRNDLPPAAPNSTLPSGGDAGPVADDPDPDRSESATPEPLPGLDCGGVADETPEPQQGDGMPNEDDGGGVAGVPSPESSESATPESVPKSDQSSIAAESTETETRSKIERRALRERQERDALRALDAATTLDEMHFAAMELLLPGSTHKDPVPESTF